MTIATTEHCDAACRVIRREAVKVYGRETHDDSQLREYLRELIDSCDRNDLVVFAWNATRVDK